MLGLSPIRPDIFWTYKDRGGADLPQSFFLFPELLEGVTCSKMSSQFADLKMDLQKLIFNNFQCICSLIISRLLSQRRHCLLSLLIDVAGGARLICFRITGNKGIIYISRYLYLKINEFLTSIQFPS